MIPLRREENKNIDNLGVADESLPGQNNDFEATVNDDTFKNTENDNIADVAVADESLFG